MDFLNKYKNYSNKNSIYLILIVLILFVFLKELNLFINVYSLFNKSHDKRMIEAYEKSFFSGFCKGSSHGYLIYIKNKFPEKFINKIPKIINNFNGKTEYWIFFDINKEIDENMKIILNKNKDTNFKNYKIVDQKYNKCFFLEKND